MSGDPEVEQISRESSPENTNVASEPITLGNKIIVLTANVVHDREEHYDIDDIVDKMLSKRDRLIPGSVYKPHSDKVFLIESASLGQPVREMRVFFTYPKYCFKDNSNLVP